MMNNYIDKSPGFLDDFSANDQQKFYIRLGEGKMTLEWFYCVFFDSPTLKQRYHLTDNPEDLSNREHFLSYLSDLLREGEVKMRVFDQSYEVKEEKGQEVLYSSEIDKQDFSTENYKEGVVLLSEKWFSFENERYRKHFEFTAVLFVLPDGEFLY